MNYSENNTNIPPFRTAKIKVIGVGGAGCNAINHMINHGIDGITFVATNTDAQALLNSLAREKINLGQKMLKGLGAGGIPEIGRKGAVESEQEIKKFLEDTDMVFVVAGMGGGTGTGATPIICKIAKEQEILVVAAVTKPFSFEGRLRTTNANKGIEELKKQVDSMIIISNDKLLEMYGNNSLYESFKSADETLRQAIRSITDLIVRPAKINLDFADIKRVFIDKKNALFGTGIGKGQNKALEATKKALNCQLLEASVKGMKNAIVSIVGGTTTTLFDVNDSLDYIRKEANNDVNIAFGVNFDKEIGDAMMVTIIGTDFNEEAINYANPKHIETIRKNRQTIEKQNIDSNQKKSESFESSDLSENSEQTTRSTSDIDENDNNDLPPFM